MNWILGLLYLEHVSAIWFYQHYLKASKWKPTQLNYILEVFWSLIMTPFIWKLHKYSLCKFPPCPVVLKNRHSDVHGILIQCALLPVFLHRWSFLRTKVFLRSLTKSRDWSFPDFSGIPDFLTPPNPWFSYILLIQFFIKRPWSRNKLILCLASHGKMVDAGCGKIIN